MIREEVLSLPEAFRPPVNRQMIELDRSFFTKDIPLAGAFPTDTRHIQPLKNAFEKSRDILDVKSVKYIQSSPASPSGKCLLLRPDIVADNPLTYSPTILQALDEQLMTLHPFTVHLTYEDWATQDILQAILPEEQHDEIPSGFAHVGHVAHVNIRKQYLPYKYLIGQLIKDKGTNITTVINKVEDVGSDSVFRTFPYEVLAGPDNLDVELVHNDCKFRFNFGKVYWNTRLNTEHSRIMSKFKKGEVVCDVMAGVGPFAVPAGKHQVFVWANDLNPDCYTSLQDAIKRNKVDAFVRASNVDGRDFIRNSARELLIRQRKADITPKAPSKPANRKRGTERRKSPVRAGGVAAQGDKAWKITLQEPQTFNHYVMNLPATAVEFLDAFKGLYKGHEHLFDPSRGRELPMVHVYLFSPVAGTSVQEAKACCELVSQHLGHVITPDTPDVEIYNVRLVAPRKWQFCVSFRLPLEIAFAI